MAHVTGEQFGADTETQIVTCGEILPLNIRGRGVLDCPQCFVLEFVSQKGDKCEIQGYKIDSFCPTDNLPELQSLSVWLF